MIGLYCAGFACGLKFVTKGYKVASYWSCYAVFHKVMKKSFKGFPVCVYGLFLYVQEAKEINIKIGAK